MLAASAMYGTAGSGAHATHSRTWSCSRSSALHSAVLTTQTLAVWSLLQLSSRDPSWLDLTCRTHSRWPVNVFTQYLTPQHRSSHHRPSPVHTQPSVTGLWQWPAISRLSSSLMAHQHINTKGHFDAMKWNPRYARLQSLTSLSINAHGSMW